MASGRALVRPVKPMVAFVFKTMADQFSGRINVFRVFQGTMKSDANILAGEDGHKERVGQLLKTRQGDQARRVARGRRHRFGRQAQGGGDRDTLTPRAHA